MNCLPTYRNLSRCYSATAPWGTNRNTYSNGVLVRCLLGGSQTAAPARSGRVCTFF